MKDLLRKAVTEGALREIDVQLACFFATEEEPLLMTAIAWLSAEVGRGHVCLPLAQMEKAQLFNYRHNVLADEVWQRLGTPNHASWQQALLAAEVVGCGERATPFVYQDDRFYLQRMWQDEGRVAAFFSRPRLAELNLSNATAILNELFGTADGEINWQKVAAAVALRQKTTVISGGPGTGKTTTVARLLGALIKTQPERKWQIKLAAPTGKAAARLTESLGQAIESLPLTEEQKRLIPSEAATIHRLLGVRVNSAELKHHRDNPLFADVLVVDEASMIDLPMMARLIDALPAQCHFILLGDREQLASVEAGAVLGDICQFVEQGYSEPQRALLSQLTGYSLPASQQQAPVVRDSLCLLRKSYRFDAASGIGQLAAAINIGDVTRAHACFDGDFSDIQWCALASEADYQQLISTSVNQYQDYLKLVRLQAKPADVLAAFGQFQLLCALRSGPYGVDGLNEQIEQALSRRGAIHKSRFQRWYAGRPVMITRNDAALGLFNGDIGIALYDEEGVLKVHFPQLDAGVRAIQPNRLPSCDTVYAMTVHKSQGSEFAHTLLVLPDSFSPLLSRELLYTAVTRAKRQLTLFSNETVFSRAIRQPTQRRSGLTLRLK